MQKPGFNSNNISIENLLICEQEQVQSGSHVPLYYYVALIDGTTTTYRNFDNLKNYVLTNYNLIKIINGIVDEDANGYTIFINNFY